MGNQNRLWYCCNCNTGYLHSFWMNDSCVSCYHYRCSSCVVEYVKNGSGGAEWSRPSHPKPTVKSDPVEDDLSPEEAQSTSTSLKQGVVANEQLQEKILPSTVASTHGRKANNDQMEPTTPTFSLNDITSEALPSKPSNDIVRTDSEYTSESNVTNIITDSGPEQEITEHSCHHKKGDDEHDTNTRYPKLTTKFSNMSISPTDDNCDDTHNESGQDLNCKDYESNGSNIPTGADMPTQTASSHFTFAYIGSPQNYSQIVVKILGTPPQPLTPLFSSTEKEKNAQRDSTTDLRNVENTGQLQSLPGTETVASTQNSPKHGTPVSTDSAQDYRYRLHKELESPPRLPTPISYPISLPQTHSSSHCLQQVGYARIRIETVSLSKNLRPAQTVDNEVADNYDEGFTPYKTDGEDMVDTENNGSGPSNSSEHEFSESGSLTSAKPAEGKAKRLQSFGENSDLGENGERRGKKRRRLVASKPEVGLNLLRFACPYQ
ncbi:hypothetical protein BX600DRAFT_551297, partial [Xylariales sp. PMI_506]